MLRWLSLGAVVLGVVSDFSFGKILKTASEMLTHYDFVVVGGGTAGNVIANRLTEDPNIRVLVIEAGGSNEGVQLLEVPFFSQDIYKTKAYFWNYTTTPQVALAGKSFFYARGHVLGGCSSTNGMAYTRGSAEDYDKIANITGDEGWSWDQLQYYIRKHERWSTPTASPMHFDPSAHGFHGMTEVSLSSVPHSIDEIMIKATEGNSEFPFNIDYNSGRPLGFGWQQTTITSNGRRDSSATSYLGPKFIQRSNLHVLLNHRVLRLLPAGSPGAHFNAVEFVEIVDGVVGPQHVITASKEIVLSAGSVGTPAILLHSGIGDSNTLSALGIKPLHHLPSVGQNFTEQPAVAVHWLVNDTNTSEQLRNNSLAAELLDEWENNKPSLLSAPPSTHLGFLRLPDNASVFENTPDPSAGSNTPHIELFISNGALLSPLPPAGNFLGIVAIGLTPVSRGSISLETSNPLDQPLIDPALLVHDFDRWALREALRLARRFVALPAWKDYILEIFGSLATADFDDDSRLDEYIQENAGMALHPVGSASMSPVGARWGVTDPDLKVKGVYGLRVVDASVIPHMPSAHTQAPVYIIAERAADLIKESWGIV
ncbi:GMC oxidoreductase family protein [Pleurotus pulmonarius]